MKNARELWVEEEPAEEQFIAHAAIPRHNTWLQGNTSLFWKLIENKYMSNRDDMRKKKGKANLSLTREIDSNQYTIHYKIILVITM